jgi:hypothetical protein
VLKKSRLDLVPNGGRSPSQSRVPANRYSCFHDVPLGLCLLPALFRGTALRPGVVEPALNTLNRLPFLVRLHGQRSIAQLCTRRVRSNDFLAVADPVAAMGKEWDEGFPRQVVRSEE